MSNPSRILERILDTEAKVRFPEELKKEDINPVVAAAITVLIEQVAFLSELVLEKKMPHYHCRLCGKIIHGIPDLDPAPIAYVCEDCHRALYATE